jgi:hypothetical protein
MIIVKWDQEAGVDGWNIYFSNSLNDRGLRLNSSPVKQRHYVIKDRKYGLYHGREYYIRLASLAGGMEINTSKPLKMIAYYGGIDPKSYTKTFTLTPKPTSTEVVVKKLESPKLEITPIRKLDKKIEKIKTIKPRPSKTYTPKPKPTRKPKPTKSHTPKPKPTRKPKPTKTSTPKPLPTPRPTPTPKPKPTKRPTIPRPSLDAPTVKQQRGLLKLAWKTQSGVDGWNIYFSADNKKFTRANKKLIREPSYQVRHSTIISGKNYFVQIVTVRGGIEGKHGNSVPWLAVPDKSSR